MAILGTLLSACFNLSPRTTVPITIIHSNGSNEQADTLIIMLPGIHDRGKDFQRHGFFDNAPNNVDIVAADMHRGYYQERSMDLRLHEDVILPAKAQGYKHIWLLGISLGGFGATVYADKHPDFIDGLILLAPYPGEISIINAIRQAGGLQHWSSDDKMQVEQRSWMWLKSITQTRRIPILLGYGGEDKFAAANHLLAEQLPATHVFISPGGHDWKTWQTLWKKIVVTYDFTNINSHTRENKI